MKLIVILLAMAATAGGALHSWHTRTLYVRAALLSEAHTLAAPVMRRVADHYVRDGVLPHDNDDAGLPPPKSIYGTSVRRVAINRGGVLIVDFDEEIGREAMTFTPTTSSANGALAWRCTSDSIDRAVLELMRPGCDYLPATLESRLMHAIANRDADLVGRLLEEGARADALVHGNTPLMLAAKIGEIAVVDRLLAAGAQIDNGPLDAERRTPLMVAITSDRPEVAALLLSHGASVTREDHRGLTALDHAVATDRRLGGERYVLMVSARLNPRFAGADATVPSAPLAAVIEHDSTLAARYGELRGAARDCHVQRLASLLREAGDLARPEIVAGEPLATHKRKPECTDRLTAHLAGKDSYRAARAARLRMATSGCETREIETMLRDEPDLDVLADEGGEPSPLERAISVGCVGAVRLMIRERSLEGVLDDDVLLHAVRRAPQDTLVRMVGTLIAAGANVDARDADERTALGEAIALEQPVVAKYLVDAGADVDAPTANGSRAVIEATKKGYEHLVVELIREGVELDARDALGRTALHAAVASGRERLVDVLVRAGADVRRRDGDGIDAVLLAESRDLHGIRTLLVASGEE